MATPRERVLDAIDNDDLTWTTQINGRTIIKWWESEHEYRLLTVAERRHLHELIAEGVIKQRQGWRYGIGGYERVR